ncbi:flagellar biosynthesis regulator FlaF [Parvibaculum sp.]|jgi:flagellar protein FlaF|uniref:flagellar biosynthesis regulator FlaF n=1 Tax=Parvibaculum sp. TaxID=2024848 RepID=UPI003C719749
MRQINAYKETKEEIVAPRDMERRIFERVTDQLRLADKEESRTEFFHRAVLENRRLWAALASDVVDPSNQMPNELKAGLLSLAIWVERESSSIHSGDAPVSGLIEVNQAMIAGLSASS